MKDTVQKNWRLPNRLLAELDQARQRLRGEIGQEVDERDAVQAAVLMWARANLKTQALWLGVAGTHHLEPITRRHRDSATDAVLEEPNRPPKRRRRR